MNGILASKITAVFAVLAVATEAIVSSSGMEAVVQYGALGLSAYMLYTWSAERKEVAKSQRELFDRVFRACSALVTATEHTKETITKCAECSKRKQGLEEEGRDDLR